MKCNEHSHVTTFTFKQLLLTRLKELCELSLAKIGKLFYPLKINAGKTSCCCYCCCLFLSVNLRNAVELLEFSETYYAQQLKNSCLQFICVNASCFFEGRYVLFLE